MGDSFTREDMVVRQYSGEQDHRIRESAKQCYVAMCNYTDKHHMTGSEVMSAVAMFLCAMRARFHEEHMKCCTKEKVDQVLRDSFEHVFSGSTRREKP